VTGLWLPYIHNKKRGHFTLNNHKKEGIPVKKRRLKKRTYKQPLFYGITFALSFQSQYIKLRTTKQPENFLGLLAL
jgi:hypothetical protein